MKIRIAEIIGLSSINEQYTNILVLFKEKLGDFYKEYMHLERDKYGLYEYHDILILDKKVLIKQIHPDLSPLLEELSECSSWVHHFAKSIDQDKMDKDYERINTLRCGVGIDEFAMYYQSKTISFLLKQDLVSIMDETRKQCELWNQIMTMILEHMRESAKIIAKRTKIPQEKLRQGPVLDMFI